MDANSKATRLCNIRSQTRVILRTFIHVFGTCSLLLSSPSFAAEESTANPGFAFVQKYCLACHDATTKEGELDLSRFGDQSAVLSSRKLWSRALQHVRNREMPPREAEQPTLDERDAFLQTMRTFFREFDATAPADPGRVTVRRLNRTEYNNTIRDLCMIEFQPAFVFPLEQHARSATARSGCEGRTVPKR